MSTLFVSDLDGTLLNSQSRLSEHTIDTLNALIERGALFTYATARSFNSARIVTRGLKLRLPAIIFNGAMRVDTASGELSHIQLLTMDIVDAIDEQISQSGAPVPFVYSFIDGRERVSYIEARLTSGMRMYMASRPGDARFRAVSDQAALFDGQVFYITFVGLHEQLEKTAELTRGLDCISVFQNYAHSSDENWWLEIMPRGATKAAAIRALKAELGCDRVVCFGDSVNDCSMFEVADEAYAVSGAHEELMRLATAVIDDGDNDGVANFLRARFENAEDM